MNDDVVLDFLHHYGLPTDSLTRATGGVVNPCFLTEHHAIRVNVRDPELPKFANEAANLRLAREAIAVPDVVLLDTSHEVVPYDVLVTTRVHGVPVASLPEREQDAFVVPAAEWLARLHTVRTPHFGWQNEPSGPTRWSDFLADRWERAARTAVARGYLSAAQVARGEAIVLNDVPPTTPTLTHHDWHFGNLLQHDGVLVAAIDFEWSEGFDPVMDLSNPLSGHPAKAEFQEAYAAVGALPTDWRDRIERYSVLTTTEFLPILEDKLGPAYDWARTEFVDHLAALRRRCG